MLSKTEIIESFGKIMTGYLLFMEQSEVVINSKYVETILYNGANIVIHVFTMFVSNGQPIENILKQCCKTYICYLEYIEQIDKTNLANNLYISDISAFVYKMVFSDLNNVTNISASNRNIIDLLVKNWNVLMSWNTPISLEVKIAICDIHLVNYTKLFYNITNASLYRDYLDCIQNKFKMSEKVYFMFLNEYYKSLYKMKKKNTISSIEEKHMVFIATHQLIDTPTSENIHDIVKLLL